MKETTVSPSRGIHIFNEDVETNQELPKELKESMKKHVRSGVDGFIIGEHSGKIIKRSEVQLAIKKPEFYTSVDSHSIGDTGIKGDERKMNDNNNNSMDTLFNELKSDMREREDRSRREISEREERFEKQMERNSAEALAREERITKALEGLETKFEAYSSKMETIKNQNFWGNIALFAAMLAIVITLVIAVFK